MLPENSAPASSPAPATPSIFLFPRPYGPRIHMDEDVTPAFSDSSAPTARVAPADTGTDISVSQAARALQAARKPKQAAAESAPDPAAAPEAEPESPPTVEEDAAPLAEDPGETASDAEPAQEPPIARPRSWTKDEDAEWQSLPRAMQQKIVAREQERDSGTRRSQNEAAEARKAAQAQVAQAEQTRQQYEGKLKSVVEVLEKEQLRDFPEIRSVADLEKMSTDMMRLVETDPLESLKLQARLRAWDTHQQKLAAAHQDLKQADERKVQTARSDWMKFVQEENAKAAEHIPDLADKAKAADLTNKAATKLRDVGFTDEELQGFEKGEKVSLFDHRVQRLLFDAVRYTVAKVAPKPVAKVVPPVQRPGVTQPRSSEASVRIQTLDKQFNNSGKVDDAVALILARRNARARAS